MSPILPRHRPLGSFSMKQLQYLYKEAQDSGITPSRWWDHNLHGIVNLSPQDWYYASTYFRSRGLATCRLDNKMARWNSNGGRWHGDYCIHKEYYEHTGECVRQVVRATRGKSNTATMEDVVTAWNSLEPHRLGKNDRTLVERYVAERRRIEKMPWDSLRDPVTEHHLVRTSGVDGTMIVYTKDFDHFRRDIQTRIKPGRYLKKYYPTLSDDEIRRYVEEFNAAGFKAYKPVLLIDNNDPKWKNDTGGLMDAWYIAYRDVIVDYSCMRGGKEAPKAYGLPGNHLGLVTWVAKDTADATRATWFGRTIVRTDTKKYVRVYPFQNHEGDAHEANLAKHITRLGYAQGGLQGIRIHALEHTSGFVDLLKRGEVKAYHVPYLDGGVTRINIGVDGETFTIAADGDYPGGDADGIARIYDDDTVTCDHCGDNGCDPDNMTSVDDDLVCQECLSQYYCYVPDEGYCLTRDAVYLEYIDEYRRDGDDDVTYIDSGGRRGQYMLVEDAIYFERFGQWWYYYDPELVDLDEENSDGESRIPSDYTVTTEDGRVIDERDAVQTVHGFLYHTADDTIMAFGLHWGRDYVHENDFLVEEFWVRGNTLIWDPSGHVYGALTLREWYAAESATLTTNMHIANLYNSHKWLRVVGEACEVEEEEAESAALLLAA